MAAVGAALWALLALPPVQHALTATMTLQMLAQIPLLAVAGWWVARSVSARAVRVIAGWNHGGISGLLLASLVAMAWMLPRAMDAAVDDPLIALAKFASVPLLIGAPLALSWPRMGFVVGGVFFVEVIATTFRLGWLYEASPVRLCANYLLGDQRLLGEILLGTGAAICLLLAWQLLWGRIQVERPQA
ncbi:MAG: hypothetical protein ACREP0_04990 [Rhodanobacteraceae bacterium]